MKPTENWAKRKTWHGEPHMPYFQIPDFPLELRRQIGSLAQLTGRTTGEVAVRAMRAGMQAVYEWVQEVQAEERTNWKANGE